MSKARLATWLAVAGALLLSPTICGWQFTLGELRSACSPIVAFPYIIGTANAQAGEGARLFLIVAYQVPIDRRACDTVFSGLYYDTAWVAIAFDGQQVPELFRYRGPRDSEAIVQSAVDPGRARTIGGHRFSQAEWALGESLKDSPSFRPANGAGAKVFSSGSTDPLATSRARVPSSTGKPAHS